ncbi:hypothetical protein J8F10_14570 [Gemmata sp. G18]|uniref:DUF4262 domain-containing protein n=1 Tax=Gemmata palustris TaxID=2822762 RepID=A0ABS5BRZ6_9BACT|nr:hypothetical protein [Gemmata palustris]MBP3956500.1 hypothetical protein [Gemmata palustris]
MGLASHSNVHNTCLRILDARGYTLRVTGEVIEEGQYPTDCHWIAEKDDFYFCADNPIELLGLVAIRDYMQPTEDVPYWWRTKGPDLTSELLERAFGDCKLGTGRESFE